MNHRYWTIGFCALALQMVMPNAAAEKPAPAARQPAGGADYTAVVKPFFEKHCIKCHGPEKSKGKMTLHTLDGDLAAGQELERWEDILEALDSEDMPPEDEPQPKEGEREAVVRWIDGGLRDYVKKASDVAPVPTTRRLTNFEYQNTMRDLLGIELELAQNLPADPAKPYHFNNTAKFMMIGPDQLLRYKESARRAMASAIVDPEKPEVHRTSAKWDAKQAGKGGLTQAEIAVYQGPGVGNRTVGVKSWPATGEFRIRIKAAGALPPGFDEVPLRLVMGTALRSDAGSGVYHPIGTVHLTNSSDNLQEYEFRGRIENIPVQPSRSTKRGVQPPSITITAQNIFDNGELNDHRKSGFDASWSLEAPRVVLTSLEFEAPVADVWPPEHHTRILFKSPLRKTDTKQYAYDVIERFMERAFRRPVAREEVDQFYAIYKIYNAEFDTLEESMRETLAMVLISPQFLYHTVIRDSPATKQYELASRLSYFLWGSMPDEELFDLAAKGKLANSAVIGAQTRRLLADKRSADFVENFTTQWLSIAKMKTVNINRDLFPRFLYTVHIGERRGQERSFRPTIRDDMEEETIGFIGELIKRNASVMNIVESDFAYLNERLAVHYGVEGVKGLGLRPVPIKPEHRLGGLLTQGSVLIGNSTGSAPHPIYRAVWLREAILGDEVKPPPAEVPALSDSAGDSADESSSIKDLLALHRTKESCADCHVRLDPWGIPFERYSAIGKYQPFVPRDGTKIRGFNHKEDQTLDGYGKYLETLFKVEVDASSRVPHGPKVDGMKNLKTYLLKDRQDEIAQNVIRRLMTYGIARELTYRDRFEVEELLEEAGANDYKFKDMIISICQSGTFSGIKTIEK
jgi:mono/diheme cytochrome c family protein